MKKILLYSLALLAISSCSLFKMDNFDAPGETLTGKVVDRDGNAVLTDQGSEGIRVRMLETSWPNATWTDFYCMPDGTFNNTKIFEADYNVRVDGPFIPIVREDVDGNVIEDRSVNTHIKGTCKVTFIVDPFLKVEVVDLQVAGGTITAKVQVDRATTKERFKEYIEPMGDYSEDFVNVTDIQLFVGYSNRMGFRNRDQRWSNGITYAGTDFEPLLGKPVSISSIGNIPSGRKVFIRAAARINYDTPRGSGTRRYNYSEVIELDIP